MDKTLPYWTKPVLTSHDVSGILNSKVNIWMADSILLKYQLLLEGPVTKLEVCGNLNPATFLPEKENETPDHDCSQSVTKQCSSGGSNGYPTRQS